jgi:hypothetical protein
LVAATIVAAEREKEMKAVTIIGCATGWENAPSSGECWGITNIVLRRDVTAAFDIHDLSWGVQDWYTHYGIWIYEHMGRNSMVAKAQKRVEQMPYVFERINELKIPLYSTSTYPDVPTSVAYPIDEIRAHFATDLFASTFDYVIAKAIYDGYERIDLYGLKMSMSEEYAHQLLSANHWIGVAKGRGIEVNVHGDSYLLKNRRGIMYGYNIPCEV